MQIVKGITILVLVIWVAFLFDAGPLYVTKSIEADTVEVDIVGSIQRNWVTYLILAGVVILGISASIRYIARRLKKP